MAIKITKIAKWLKQIDIKYELKKGKQQINFVTSDHNELELHKIQLRENGEMFQWEMHLLDSKTENLFHISHRHQHSAQLFQYALQLNSQRKFGRWEYSKSQEEMVFSVTFPIEDGTLTKKQFQRIFGLVIHNAKEEVSQLKEILQTGEIPRQEEVLSGLLNKAFEKYMQQAK